MQRQRVRDNEEYLGMVDFIFSNEEGLREAIEDARCRQVTISELRNASALSDPTAAEAIRNLTPVNEVEVKGRKVRQPEKWLEVMERSYKYISGKGINQYQAAKAFYSNIHYAKICCINEISVDKFYRIISSLRNRAALLAAQYHLIRIE